jgi:Flp pilus assembly protein TadD
MPRTKNILMIAAMSLSLTACGEDQGTRALSGGAIGAAAGAIIGAATGGSAATGALIGGGIGALGGAATNAHQVYLGDPIIGH